jgi:hypothetical protein
VYLHSAALEDPFTSYVSLKKVRRWKTDQCVTYKMHVCCTARTVFLSDAVELGWISIISVVASLYKPLEQCVARLTGTKYDVGLCFSALQLTVNYSIIFHMALHFFRCLRHALHFLLRQCEHWASSLCLVWLQNQEINVHDLERPCPKERRG